jgi:hypothetical protein
MNQKYVVVPILIGFSMIAASAQDHSMKDCPMAQDHHHGNMNHRDSVNARGDKGMGFDHLKTTHHFRLFADGGAIEVSANEANDSVSQDQIRGHLGQIARMFSEGNFSIPMFVHDQVPPGVETMKQQKAAISYRYERTESGGQLRISTSNAEALRAIHEFLRFQIQEHQTGDPSEVNKP